jgi:hypothetical protein
MTTEPTSIDPPEPADDQRDWFRGHLDLLVDTPVPDGWATIADRVRNGDVDVDVDASTEPTRRRRWLTVAAVVAVVVATAGGVAIVHHSGGGAPRRTVTAANPGAAGLAPDPSVTGVGDDSHLLTVEVTPPPDQVLTAGLDGTVSVGVAVRNETDHDLRIAGCLGGGTGVARSADGRERSVFSMVAACRATIDTLSPGEGWTFVMPLAVASLPPGDYLVRLRLNRFDGPIERRLHIPPAPFWRPVDVPAGWTLDGPADRLATGLNVDPGIRWSGGFGDTFSSCPCQAVDLRSGGTWVGRVIVATSYPDQPLPDDHADGPASPFPDGRDGWYLPEFGRAGWRVGSQTFEVVADATDLDRVVAAIDRADLDGTAFDGPDVPPFGVTPAWSMSRRGRRGGYVSWTFRRGDQVVSVTVEAPSIQFSLQRGVEQRPASDFAPLPGSGLAASVYRVGATGRVDAVLPFGTLHAVAPATPAGTPEVSDADLAALVGSFRPTDAAGWADYVRESSGVIEGSPSQFAASSIVDLLVTRWS